MSHWISTLSQTPRPMTPCTQQVSESGGGAFYLTVPDSEPRLSVVQSQEFTLSVEGWLYNEDELRKELKTVGKPSLAALILQAYRHWGEAFLEKLNGAFALCLWDSHAQTILAARDALGVYPLFYAHSNNAWFFSPSLEELRKQPTITTSLNRGALVAHLFSNGRDIEETFYNELKRVPPGHSLKIRTRSSSVSLSRYWFPLPEGEVTWTREEDLAHFPELMTGAIARCLQLGQAGIFLSGGLDSGTIATYAAKYSREQQLPPPLAFSLYFQEPGDTEELFQRGIAQGLGLPQTGVPLNTTSDALEAYFASLELNKTWSQPLASSFISLYLSLGKKAKDAGCDFMLSGEGGDEWLVIHYALAADLLRNFDVRGLRDFWKTVKATNELSSYGTAEILWLDGLRLLLLESLGKTLSRVAPGQLRAHRHEVARQKIPSWLAPDPALREDVFARWDKGVTESKGSSSKGSFYKRDILGIVDHPLTVLYAEEEFELSQRIGLPILLPFYDPEVIRFLARTPPHLRGQGGRFKGLLRTLLHQHFPSLGYDRQEKPYANDFFGNALHTGLKQSWKELGGVQALADLGIVDGALVERQVADLMTTSSGLSEGTLKSLWPTLCSEVWVRSHVSA
jgi:asparagine synthase (glutamine-hydrolysing)